MELIGVMRALQNLTRGGARLRSVDRRKTAIRMVTAVYMALVSSVPPSLAEVRRQVWFTPGEDSVDLTTLFTKPDLWASTRSAVNVYVLSPGLVGAKSRGPNGIDQLARIDAFSRLREWGISLGIEAPAIKRWDCSSQNTLKRTKQFLENTRRAGGHIEYIAMDEPLASAQRDCHLSKEVAADQVAGYIKSLRTLDSSLIIGDIIAYPSFTVNDIEQWEGMLTERGAKPAFVHLDVDVNRLDRSASTDYPADLRLLMQFGNRENIPLGVIFWPGRNPISSSESYYNLTLNWVKRVHAAIGAPDHAVFESWVIRSSRSCVESDRTCRMTAPQCEPSDGPECGLHSVPINLPDDDSNTYSHTRLIKDSLRELKWGG
jgi:hypothetical protein